MDSRFNKTLILTVSLSCLFLSCNATRILNIPPVGAPAPAESNTNRNNLLLSNLFDVAGSAAQKFKMNPEITGFCSGAENPVLCAQTIAPVLVTGAFDPLKALSVSIEATLGQAQSVSSVIAKQLSDPNTPKMALDALGICKKSYDDILDTIKEALELIPQHNVVDAYYKFSAVISDKGTCDDAFVESPGVENPLTGDSQTLFQLGGNCLAIMDTIVNHSRV